MTVEWSRAADGDDKINGRYQRFKTCIGKGAFKTVYEAFDKTAQIDVAWNVVDLSQVRSGDELRKIRKETEILKSLKHKNILSISDTWLNETQDRLIFITDIMRDGSLLKYIMNRDITLGRVKQFCKQILSALCYLHRGIGAPPKPVIHRDLKCDNIFIDAARNHIVIGDLGLSVVVSQKPMQGQSVVGTPEFMAPEMYEEKYNTKVDIYAFGMCLLQMVTKKYPYQECHTLHQVYKKVTRRELPAILKTLVSKSVKDYILICCHFEQEHRPTADQLLRHPFLNLQYPNDNLSCSAIVAPETEKTECKFQTPKIHRQPSVEDLLPSHDVNPCTPLPTELKEGNWIVNRHQEGSDWSMSAQAQTATQFTYRSDQTGSAKSTYSIERSAQIVRAEKYKDTGHFRIFVKIMCEIDNHPDGVPNFAMKSVSFDYTPGEDTPKSIAREMVNDLGLKHEMLAAIEEVLSWESINEHLRIVDSDQSTPQMTKEINVSPNGQTPHENTSPILKSSSNNRRQCLSLPLQPNPDMGLQSSSSKIQKTSLPNFHTGQAVEDYTLAISCNPNTPEVIYQDRIKPVFTFDGTCQKIPVASSLKHELLELRKCQDQHTIAQRRQPQALQYSNTPQNLSHQTVVARNQQWALNNPSVARQTDDCHQSNISSLHEKNSQNYLLASSKYQKHNLMQQTSHMQPSLSSYQRTSTSGYETSSPEQNQRVCQKPSQIPEDSNCTSEAQSVKIYQQVSNYQNNQPCYNTLTSFAQTPLKPFAPSNAKQIGSHHSTMKIQTGHSGDSPSDNSPSQTFQPNVKMKQQFDLAPQEYSSVEKSSSDQLWFSTEASKKNKSFELQESPALKHGCTKPLLPIALKVHNNRVQTKVISNVISQGLVEECKGNFGERQSRLSHRSDSIPSQHHEVSHSIENLSATKPRNWSSTLSQPQQLEYEKTAQQILPPTHPNKKNHLINLVSIDIKRTRRASDGQNAHTAPNSSRTEPPIGSLAITSPKCSSSSSRDRALSEPGSPRKLHRNNYEQFGEEKLGSIRADQEKYHRKVKPKRQGSTKQTKKEQIKQKILEEQKKLSDKTLVGKDAKCAKGKEGSLTKTLTKKPIDSTIENIPSKVEVGVTKSDSPDFVMQKGMQLQEMKPDLSQHERRLEWLKISRCLAKVPKQRERIYRSSETSDEATLLDTDSKTLRIGSDAEVLEIGHGQVNLSEMMRQSSAPHVSDLTPPFSTDRILSDQSQTANDFNSKVEKHLTTINRKLTDNRQKVMSEYRQRLDEINEHMELWYNHEKEKTVDPGRKQRIVGHLSNFKTQFDSMKEESKYFENRVGLQIPKSPVSDSR